MEISEIGEINKLQENLETSNSMKSANEDVKSIKSFSSPSSQFASPTHQHNYMQMGPGVCYPCCISPHFQYPDQNAVRIRSHIAHECSPPRITYPHINPQMYVHPYTLQHPGYQVQPQILNMQENINSAQRIIQPSDLRFSNPNQHIIDPLFNPYAQYLPPHQNSEYNPSYPTYQLDPYYYDPYALYETYAALPSYQINYPITPQYRYAQPHTHESGYHSDGLTSYIKASPITAPNSEAQNLTKIEDSLLQRVLSPSESFESTKLQVVDEFPVNNCSNSDKLSDKSSERSLSKLKNNCESEDYYFEDKLVDKPNVGISFGDNNRKNNDIHNNSFNTLSDGANLIDGDLFNQDLKQKENFVEKLTKELDFLNVSTQLITEQGSNEASELINSEIIVKPPVSYSLELDKTFNHHTNSVLQNNKSQAIRSPIAYSFDLDYKLPKDNDDKCFVKQAVSYSVDIVRFNADGTSVDETKLDTEKELKSDSDTMLERNKRLIEKVEGIIADRVDANMGCKHLGDDVVVDVVMVKKIDNLNHGSYSPPERDITSETKKDSLAFTIDFGSDDGKPEISANWKNFKDFKPRNSRKFGNRSDSLDQKKNRKSNISDGNASAISNDQEDGEPSSFQNLETRSAKNSPIFLKSINKPTKQILKQTRSYSQPNAKEIIPRVQTTLSKPSPLVKNSVIKKSAHTSEAGNSGFKNISDSVNYQELGNNKRINDVKSERYYGERNKTTVLNKGYKDSDMVDNRGISNKQYGDSGYQIAKSKGAMTVYGNVSESKLKPSQRLSSEALRRSEGYQSGIDVKGYLMRRMLNQGIEDGPHEVEAVSRLSSKIGEDERSEAGTYTIDRLDSNILSPVNHRELPEHIYEEEEDLKNENIDNNEEENIGNIETRICGETDFGTFTMTFDAPKKRPSPKPCSQTVNKNIASLETKKKKVPTATLR